MSETDDSPRARRFLPAPGSLRYHLLLGAVALFILGPLGGITAAYMTFSLGLLRGRPGAGRHSRQHRHLRLRARRQARRQLHADHGRLRRVDVRGWACSSRRWSGSACRCRPPGKLVLYFGCIGMFGIGVGMLYTPILVDRMQLEFPSGHAVANILRALTDKRLLRRSVGKLGGGTVAGIARSGDLVEHVAWLRGWATSASRRRRSAGAHRRLAHRRAGARHGRRARAAGARTCARSACSARTIRSARSGSSSRSP